MLRLFTIIGFIITILALAPTASAAKLVMRDGRVFHGTILEENTEHVVIEVLISNIRSTLTLPKHRIETIERDPSIAPSSTADRPDTENPKSKDSPSNLDTARTSPERRRKTDRAPKFRRYLEIPINGVFGRDIMPSGVEASLKRAKSIGLDTIVFTINSDGGSVWAADEIVDILQEYENDFEYHAVIKNAISASIWVALSCDTAFIEPDGTIGGAVVFSQSNTGEASVDQKVLSIYRSKLSALGRKRGFDPDLISAMIDPRAEVYFSVHPETGVATKVSARAPLAPGRQYLIEDDKLTVLTLTGDQAVQVGFCQLADGTAPDLLKSHVDAIEWRPSGRYGEKQMSAAADRFRAARKKNEAAIAQFKASVENAKYNDPFRFSYRRYGGRLEANDRKRWITRAEKTSMSLNQAAAALKTLRSLQREAKKLRAAGSGLGKGVDIETEKRRISDWLDRLHREWNNI